MGRRVIVDGLHNKWLSDEAVFTSDGARLLVGFAELFDAVTVERDLRLAVAPGARIDPEDGLELLVFAAEVVFQLGVGEESTLLE